MEPELTIEPQKPRAIKGLIPLLAVVLILPLVLVAASRQTRVNTRADEFPITPPTSPISPTNTSVPAFYIASLLNPSPATFNFTETGQSEYRIDLSTVANMSTDVYLSFGVGTTSPIVVSDPTKWAKYTCGTTLYWRVRTTVSQSPIQSAVVTCPTNSPTPTLTPIATLTPSLAPSLAPSPTPIIPTPTQIPATTNIVIYAAGSPVLGVYPNMTLAVKNTKVATWNSVQGVTATRSFLNFNYVHPSRLVLGNKIRVNFTNDRWIPGVADRNLLVDAIEVNNVRYESEDPTVKGQGVGANENSSCTSGNKQVEWINCKGFLEFTLK